jgi:TolA-binding protein
MRILRHVALFGALLLMTGCSGAEAPEARHPGSDPDELSASMERDRQAFVTDKHDRVDELEQRIRRLRVRIDAQSEVISAETLADWNHELLELEREQADAEARIERLSNAPRLEWLASRDGIAYQVGRLERSVTSLEANVTRAAPDEAADGERVPVRGADDADEGAEDSSE